MLGGSAFNIKAKSLRLGDFSEQEVRALLGQHTATTGQAFTEEAVRLILTRTAGQPWLVNALCNGAPKSVSSATHRAASRLAGGWGGWCRRPLFYRRTSVGAPKEKPRAGSWYGYSTIVWTTGAGASMLRRASV